MVMDVVTQHHINEITSNVLVESSVNVGLDLRGMLINLSLTLLLEPVDAIVVSIHLGFLRGNLIVTEGVKTFKLLNLFGQLIVGGLEA